MTMCIKENEQLNVLANAAGKKMAVVSKIIIEELIRRKIIVDVSDFWGCAFKDVYNKDSKVSEVIEVIQATGIETVRCEHFDAFMGLILLGDNDCPECGGEMEVTDGDYKEIFTDMMTEPFVKIIWEEKTCKVCGYRDFNGKED